MFQRSTVSRRRMLQGSGVALSLPLLDVMQPRRTPAAEQAQPPRRMVAVQTNMGILPQNFWPVGSGLDYQASPYLQMLDSHRRQLTVFRGVSHPDVDGGHLAERSFLTAAPHPASGAFRNSVSMDVVAAESLGTRTRIPLLVTRIGPRNCAGSLSVTRSGVEIAPEQSVSALYRRMFVQGTAAEVSARLNDLSKGRSILDFVSDSAARLQQKLGPRDLARMDQYLTSVRELEVQLHESSEWETRPKPQVQDPEPADAEISELAHSSKLMFDVIRLALETDSTRLVTLFISTLGLKTDIPGVSHETHTLTHHGNRPETLAELERIETAQFQALAGFLNGLQTADEADNSLLDQTMVLYGTCMGSANAHSNVNLPMLLAGGGFRHQGLLEFDTRQNYPLPNLFVSMLQRLGLETDSFASSTGTMRGLEFS